MKTRSKRAYLSKNEAEFHHFIAKSFWDGEDGARRQIALYYSAMHSQKFLPSKALFAVATPVSSGLRIHAGNISRVSTISGVDLSLPREKRTRSTNSAMWGGGSTAPKRRGLWWTVFGLFRDGADNVVYDMERREGWRRGRSKLPARSSVKMPLCDSARSRFTFEFNGNFTSPVFLEHISPCALTLACVRQLH